MKYSLKVGFLKGFKFFVLFAFPVLIDKFVVSYPEFAQLSLGAILVMFSNFLKVRYGFKNL